MATENPVRAAGTTTIDGETKVRFTADLVTRSKSWQRSGVDADFVELPEPMKRLDALYFLQKHDRFQTPERARAIWEQIFLKEALIKRDERRAKRKAKKEASTAVMEAVVNRASKTAKKMSLEEIRSRKSESI